MSNLREEDAGPRKRQRLDSERSNAAEADVDTSQPGGSGGSGESGESVRNEIALSERLCEVMLCNVCMDLPHPDENYQCSMGHIVCEDCVTRLLADAALNHREAKCPHCRIHISWEELTKNLAVGQTLWELPKSCADCQQQMECKSMAKHMKTECGKRMVQCQYRCLGCNWEGWKEASAEHEANCQSLDMTGQEILAELRAIEEIEKKGCQSLRLCHRQLSAERISYEDLDLRWPQQANRRDSEVRFHSPTISVFEHTWRVRVKLLQGDEHRLNYSLKLLSSPSEMVHVKYFATLPAMHVRAKQLRDVEQQLYEELFDHAGQSAEFKLLPMSCPIATYRLLAMPLIKLRIWMMLN